MLVDKVIISFILNSRRITMRYKAIFIENKAHRKVHNPVMAPLKRINLRIYIRLNYIYSLIFLVQMF